MPLPKSNAPCRKWTAVPNVKVSAICRTECADVVLAWCLTKSNALRRIELLICRFALQKGVWGWRNQLRCAELKWKSVDSACKMVYYPSVCLPAWLEKPGGGGGEGDREGPSPPAPLIPFPEGDPGDPIYNENGPFSRLSICFSAIAIVALMVWALRDTWDPFPRGPPRPSPLHLWNNFSSPVSRQMAGQITRYRLTKIPKLCHYQIQGQMKGERSRSRTLPTNAYLYF